MINTASSYFILYTIVPGCRKVWQFTGIFTFIQLFGFLSFWRHNMETLSTLHSVEYPSMVDPSRIYGIEGPSEIWTQSAEVRLAVSGAQPLFNFGFEGPSEIWTQSSEMRLAVSGAQSLFNLGLLMFALSLKDFLPLLLSPSTDI